MLGQPGRVTSWDASEIRYSKIGPVYSRELDEGFSGLIWCQVVKRYLIDIAQEKPGVVIVVGIMGSQQHGRADRVVLDGGMDVALVGKGGAHSLQHGSCVCS